MTNVYIPSIAEQTKAIAACKQHAELFWNLQKTNASGITSAAGLIAQYGRPFYMNEQSFVGKRKTMKACYMNSYRLATGDPDLTYVEGYVNIGIMPIEHAWVIDGAGFVIDPTLVAPDPKKHVNPLGYFGIPFKTSYIQKVALRSKVYGILYYTNRPLMTGEDKPTAFLANI
jgi:hypothetical protein